MRRYLVPILTSLLLAPHAIAAPPHIAQAVEIRAASDGSETIIWRLESRNTTLQEVVLPPDAQNISVASASGAPLGFTTRSSASALSVVLDLPAPSVIVRASRPPPDPKTHPLYVRKVFVGTGSGTETTIDVEAPPGSHLFYASAGEIVERGAALRVRPETSVTLTYSYEAPLDPAGEIVALQTDLYRVFAPRSSLGALLQVLPLAERATRAAAGEVGLPIRAPIHVRYAHPLNLTFRGSEAYYGNDGIIGIRLVQLDGMGLRGFPFAAAASLVHESFHAISLPRGRPGGAGSLDWWIEGSAQHAESFVLGDDGWISCDNAGRGCALILGLLTADALDAIYREDWTFDPNWSAHGEQPAAQKNRTSRFSGFVVSAYPARFGAAAYQAVWRDFASCPCDTPWIVERLRAAAGGISEETLFYPYRELFASDPATFRNATRSLTAEDPPWGSPVPHDFAPPGEVVPMGGSERWGRFEPPTIALAAPDAPFPSGTAELVVSVVGLSADEAWPHIAVELDGWEATPDPEIRDARLVLRFEGVTQGEHLVKARLFNPWNQSREGPSEISHTELRFRVDPPEPPPRSTTPASPVPPSPASTPPIPPTRIAFEEAGAPESATPFVGIASLLGALALAGILSRRRP